MKIKMWSLLISTSLGWVGTKKIGEWRKKSTADRAVGPRAIFKFFVYMPESAASSSPETGKWARGNSRLFHFMLVPIERRPLIMVSPLLACCVLLGFFLVSLFQTLIESRSRSLSHAQEWFSSLNTLAKCWGFEQWMYIAAIVLVLI